jgi:tetratricopeptide (TPR) repeat protein
MKDYLGAIKDYNKMIQIDSMKAIIYYLRAKAYEEIGQDKSAELDFKKAEQLDKNFKIEKWYIISIKAILKLVVMYLFLRLIEKYVLKTTIFDFIKYKFFK